MRIIFRTAIIITFICIAFSPTSSNSEWSEPSQDWSEWSEWSKCSRTCGTGLAIQSRRCHNWKGCKGNSVRYIACTLKKCTSESDDFYSTQCSDFDTKEKRWNPAEIGDSCELWCKLNDNNMHPVKLKDRVLDGTLCSNSTGICIFGECQKIGCDLIVGSGKKNDDCGICGGDGTTCKMSNPRWILQAQKNCSATCGGGYQILLPVCEDILTKKEIPATKCSQFSKPTKAVISCANIPCPATWKTETWTECSSTCGAGYQLREVYCAELRNDSYFKVADHTCDSQRPIHWRSCERKCPTWSVGAWGKCSVSCDDGVQRREVKCQYSEGNEVGYECNVSKRPNATRPCRTGIHCQSTTIPNMITTDLDNGDSFFVSDEQLHMQKKPVPAEPTFITSDWSKCSATCGEGLQTRSVKCKIFLEFSRTIPVLPDSQCLGKRPADSKRCFSTPCKYGLQSHFNEKTQIENDMVKFSSIEGSELVSDGISSEIHYQPVDKLFTNYDKVNNWKKSEENLPKRSKLKSFQGTVADGILVYKTPNSEENFSNNVPNDMSKDFIHNELVISHPYYWLADGFTPCNSPCLGGEQESIHHCVRRSDQKVVSALFCNIKERSDSITRTCNDHPCSPRWETMDYGSCSVTCGAGFKKRKLRCIHEITRSITGRMVVPDYHCKKPPPSLQKRCHENACPASWIVGKWTKCSTSCGGGFKMRTVECVKEMPQSGANNFKKEEMPQSGIRNFKKADYSESDCKTTKPLSKKLCKRRRCKQKNKRKLKKQIIRAQLTQDYEQRIYKKTVTLKIGGRATVFHGANVKIRCPVKFFDKRRLKWFKNDSRLHKRIGHIRITRKGAIKIRRIQYTDEGLYQCKANEASANLTLIVQPIPSSYGSVEEGNTILATKLDTKVESNGKAGFGKKEKMMPNIQTGNNGFIYYKKGNLPTNNNIEDFHSGKQIVDTSEFSTGKNSLGKVVYGNVNHHHNDWSRIALPKTGISLLSATLAHLNPNTNGTESVNSSQRFNSHIYGTVKNLPEKQVRIRHGKDPVIGKVNLEFSPTDSSNSQKRNSGYERPTSQNSFNDHKPRSTGIVNFYSDKLESLNGHMLYPSTSNISIGSHEILGKGNRDSLEFEWKVTNWTTCSQSCSFTGNSGGYQVRSTQCVLRVENVSRGIDSALCLDAGLGAPSTIQKCGFEECPRWKVTDWSECEKSNCFTLHYARQKRGIACIFHNGSESSFNRCDEETKPHKEKDCYNRLCIGIWKTGNWSKCIAPCGGQGYKTRLLKCVWNGTNKSAGNACRELARPEVVRWCDGAPCIDNEDKSDGKTTNVSGSACKDHSKYCKIVVRIDMCKHYRDLCCSSCQ